MLCSVRLCMCLQSSFQKRSASPTSCRVSGVSESGLAAQECIQMTIEAAASAQLPYGCTRTIYLCDDGKDQDKAEWVKSLGFG